jgi:4-diphosphocytidyl-2-C-methyl-D-erythritol kinase
LRVVALAKVNLGLEVLGLRQDGYHELRTLFQTVDLADELVLERRPSGVTLTCDRGDVPSGEQNLAWRAARDLLAYARVEGGVAITLSKRIPVAGGLGGGSSDAAAVLMGLDALYGLGLGRAGLDPLARRLGADVPFFLVGGTALGLARGDEVYSLERQVRAHVVIVCPERGISTSAVFRRLDAGLTPRENSSTIYRFVSSDLDGFAFRILSNELERAALEEAPDLAELLDRARGILSREGALLTSLSGSGSSYFGLFAEAAGARRAERALRTVGLTVHRCRTVSLDQYRRSWRRALGLGGRKPRSAQ